MAKTKKSKSTKSSRSPRPLNAFFVYMKEKTSEIQTKFPHLTQMDINKKLGQMWREEKREIKGMFNREAERRSVKQRKDIPLYSYNPSEKSECKHKENPIPRDYSDSADGNFCFIIENVVKDPRPPRLPRPVESMSQPDDCELNEYFNFDDSIVSRAEVETNLDPSPEFEENNVYDSLARHYRVTTLYD
ncbi:7301_t:CDS:1 [Diversispora eburnea]|uniref:7301_t:CDS:1 n=1 Tax=Diversispora eburnea TaxID=1213867 RepID=A0A9N8ZJ98_9GLOM|nr:7301_t:CDS:1 [Diversispora eburnea]